MVGTIKDSPPGGVVNARGGAPALVATQGAASKREHSKGRRVVFNICGNKYRLLCEVLLGQGILFVKFITTHMQYDAVNAETHIAADAATKRKREIGGGSFPQSRCYGLFTALRTPPVENSRAKSLHGGALPLCLAAEKHL